MKEENIPKAQNSQENYESGYVSLEERVDSIYKNTDESEKVKEGEYPVEHCSQKGLETPPTTEL